MPAQTDKQARPDWKQVNQDRWVRSDGAVVKWDMSSPDPNPHLSFSRMWSAWEPDPGDGYLYYTRRNTLFHVMRRWKTPEAAMKAVDREYPVKKGASDDQGS